MALRPRVLALMACLGLLAIAAPARAAGGGTPRFGHVFLIVGENTSLSQITPGHAPYLSGTLKPQAAWLTGYHSFRRSSSLGQYIAMVSGQFSRCEANNALPDRCHQRVGNLFRQLDAAGRSWREWNEGADNACDIFDHGSAWAGNIHSAHHDPSIYFTNVEGGRYDEARRPSAECLRSDLPAGTTAPNDTSALDAALASGQVGDFNLIIPNDCENGHDPCGTRDPVSQFDAFLAREIPKIEASPAWGADSAIVATWDEGGDPPRDPGHPLALLLGPRVRPGVYATRYTHYSLARTLEDGFGLGHLAHARHARPITGVWR